MDKKPNMNRRQILGLLGAGGASLLHTTVHASSKEKLEKTTKWSFSPSNLVVKDIFVEMIKDGQLKIGMVIQTLGYYEAGDGGGATYKLYPRTENKGVQAGEWMVENDTVARLVGIHVVNYAMFGAKGDGMNDDGNQIKQAHDYANLHKLPVVNLKGEYWLMASQAIHICTNVEWGTTAFHISESGNTKNSPRFVIRSHQQPQDITWSAETKKKFLEKLKPGIQQFEELTPYKNMLVIIRDDNDRIGFRAGARYGGKSWAKEEFFYVEEHGRIIGDIAWTFDDYTHLTAYPAEESYLTVDGGTFYISGEGPGTDVKGYRQNGFTITRSRTVIRNQWVGMEKDVIDTSMNPRTGFYNFSRVYDITLENIRLIPWEQDREGKERDVPAGTYGISGARVLKSYFNNIMAEGGLVHWGVFGTNLMKDLYINRCHLNRIDVHFHAWNISIRDSKIGYRGISISGGGQLTVENTESSSRFFLNFRRDYGAKWDGDIRVTNCRFIPPAARLLAALYFSPADFAYGYPIGLAHSIVIEGLRIEQPSEPSLEPCWLLYAPTFASTKHGDRLFFPRDITLRNIRVRGGRAGIRIMKLTNLQNFHVIHSKVHDGRPNSRLLLEDIDLEPLTNRGGGEIEAHLQFISDAYDPMVEDELYPQIYIVRCDGLVASFDATRLDLDIKHSVVHQLTCKSENELFGKFTFWDSTFEPHIAASTSGPAFVFDSGEGVNFINCRLSAPVVDGKRMVQALDSLGFITLNKTVKYNHIHTTFERGTRETLRAEGIKLNGKFMQKLMQNYEFKDGE